MSRRRGVWLWADPFSRPHFKPDTESPWNWAVTAVLVSITVWYSYRLGEQWMDSRTTDLHVVPEEDISEGLLPSGFSSADARIQLEVTAVLNSPDDHRPGGGSSNLTYIPYTVNDFSCPGPAPSPFVAAAGAWSLVSVCGGVPKDCRGTSVNASEPAVFLIRGPPGSLSEGSNQQSYANLSVIEYFRSATQTGVDSQLAQMVEKDMTSGKTEIFIYPNGPSRYNVHIGATPDAFCDCGSGDSALCPHYLRMSKLAVTTMVARYRESVLDTLATIVGFASGLAAVGIPVAILLRAAVERVLGKAYVAWPKAMREGGGDAVTGTAAVDMRAIKAARTTNVSPTVGDELKSDVVGFGA